MFPSRVICHEKIKTEILIITFKKNLFRIYKKIMRNNETVKHGPCWKTMTTAYLLIEDKFLIAQS